MVVSGAGSLVGAHDVVPWVDDAAARVGRLERIDAAIPALDLVDKSLSFPLWRIVVAATFSLPLVVTIFT